MDGFHCIIVQEMQYNHPLYQCSIVYNIVEASCLRDTLNNVHDEWWDSTLSYAMNYLITKLVMSILNSVCVTLLTTVNVHHYYSPH